MQAGITLLFSCQAGRRRWGMLNYYVLQCTNSVSFRKKAESLGVAEAKHYCPPPKGTCEFIGLYDVYYVSGPLRSGALLGYTSYWSWKTKLVARRHLLTDRELKAQKRNKLGFKEPRDYLFKALYLISGASIPRERRRTIKGWILVRGQGATELSQLAAVIAEERKTKLKILRNLSDRVRPSDLQFLGFSEFRKAFDPPVRNGRCFLSNVKKYRRPSEITALIQNKGQSKKGETRLFA